MTETLRIGYVPYSNDLQHPDDRRRFPFFANRLRITFEIANEKNQYAMILLPASANLTRWMEYKKRNPKTIFVFEMVDSLTYQKDWKSLMFKGAGRYLVGKEDKPCLVHRNLLIDWIRIADFVICSNPKIKDEIQKLNANALLNLDYLEHEYPMVKGDYSISGKMKLFWEGQGVVLPQLLKFKKVFKEVSSFCELHVVTAPSYPRFAYFLKRPTESLLKELPIETFFHPWNMRNNGILFSGFDCGIIPLNSSDLYGWHKPANKLISFWFSGIPTITSNTPAYSALAKENQNNFICKNEKEWIEKINWMYQLHVDQRREMAMLNYQFAKSNFSTNELDKFWLGLLDKIADLKISENKISQAA